MTALERTSPHGRVDYRGILDDAEDKDSALSVAYSAFEKVDKKLDRELYVAYGLLAISFVFACMEDYWAQHELGLLWGSAAGLGYLIAKLQQRNPAERKYLNDVIREWEQEVSGT